ncbi:MULTISPECIES: chaperone modulator CbpM [Mangrovimonas]|uniref:chaperone modulator CbpM n=1 Tax=Mangrovimonas TaxID=1211036 RepID=UPI0006B4473D|nr:MULTISPECIES: chaperone modulator CbpM [Mangrovimonas]OMP31123.1 MerR family transcriptional regulator [Mangrovimonas sp. DI 80]
MDTTHFIPISKLCSSYNVTISFLEELEDIGLISIINIEKQYYMDTDAVGSLDKILRMQRELNLNIEGIDIVFNLLQKVDALQAELSNLQNRLRLYEHD